MDKEQICLEMGMYIQDSINKVNLKVKDNINGVMEVPMLEILKMD